MEQKKGYQPDIRVGKYREEVKVPEVEEEEKSWAGKPKYRHIEEKPKSPQRQIYEAKFGRYLENKRMRDKLDDLQQKEEPEDFDIFTRGPESANA